LLILISSHGTHGYRFFQEEIPNGKKVPHPCKPNELWEGVGHFKVAGTGARNPIGVDSHANGKVRYNFFDDDDDDEQLVSNSAQKSKYFYVSPRVCDSDRLRPTF
jgi:dopamine beta-monooxygenase